MLKPLGYAISCLSVVLLGIASWSSASSNPWMAACLIAGMAASVIGMGCRLGSYLRERGDRKTARAAARAQERPDRGPDRRSAA